MTVALMLVTIIKDPTPQPGRVYSITLSVCQTSGTKLVPFLKALSSCFLFHVLVTEYLAEFTNSLETDQAARWVLLPWPWSCDFWAVNCASWHPHHPRLLRHYLLMCKTWAGLGSRVPVKLVGILIVCKITHTCTSFQDWTPALHPYSSDFSWKIFFGIFFFLYSLSRNCADFSP